MQENLSQQNQQDQEEPLFAMSMAEPHLLRPVIAARYTGHPRDLKRGIRPTIIRCLDVPLTDVYKKIVDKKLDEALFYFYNVIFPTAIHTIVEVETECLGIRETDEYISLLVKYFYLAMNEKVRAAQDYICTHPDDSYNDRSYYSYNSDGLYLDIVKSQITLYSGRTETTDPITVDLNKTDDFPLQWVFAGNNYREQIISHVALFWELFMVYHGVESKLDFFTIPEKVYYWPGEIRTVTAEAFDIWVKIPLEEKMVFSGANHYQHIKSLEEREELDF